MQIRVYYEDTDIGGMVYHADYLKFCERARSELFFSQGSSPVFEGGHFVVTHLEADFRRPATLGDLLDVTVESCTVKAASLTMKQCIYRDETLLFEMTLTLAYLMSDGSIGRLDSPRRQRLAALLDA